MSDLCIPFPDEANQIICLDGKWACQRWPFQESLNQILQDSSCDTWEQVQQPGKVFYGDPEAEKEDIPNWNRVSLDHIHEEDGALLRKKVKIPSAWKQQRVFAHFGSIFPAGHIYLNGQKVAEHMSGLTPLQVELDDHAKAGEELIIDIRLFRKHKFVKIDMVRHAMEFAGCAQSIHLFALEPCLIQEQHLSSSLDENLSEGHITGKITLDNQGPSTTGQLQTELYDPENKLISTFNTELEINSNESHAADLQLDVSTPQLWNDEKPHLYTLKTTLLINGQAPQSLTRKTGFRRLDLNPEAPKLNGQFIKFRGVNHLTFHPEFGMYTPKDWLRQNLSLMKKANVNTIRTHFLPPPALNDLCDEMGFYLIQEIPIDWGTHFIHDPEWVPPALERIKSSVQRDRHHVSLMVWGVGNENMPLTKEVSQAGWDHLRQYDALVKSLDHTRPTIFPPPGPANAIEGIIELRVGDIADTHYSFKHIKRFLKEGEVVNPNSWEADMDTHSREWALKRGWSGTWFASEYGAFNMIPDLLNNPQGSVICDEPEDLFSEKSTLQVFAERQEKEWGFMRHEKSCLGGAYFPWLCGGMGSHEAGNPWGWVRWGEDADWGVVTADLLPKPFFWALRVLFSPVWFPKRLSWSRGQSSLSFDIENQYNSIDLKDCTLRVQQNGNGRYMTMMRKFKDIPVSAAPGTTTKVTITLDDKVLDSLNDGKASLMRFNLMDPTGFRAITAEALIVPEDSHNESLDETVPIGPDAVL